MVRTVQSLNSCLIVFWMSSSVSMSTAAVASSRIRILVFRRSALARHSNCLCPTLQFRNYMGESFDNLAFENQSVHKNNKSKWNKPLSKLFSFLSSKIGGISKYTMKIYGRTRYQTQAFVDQNCWIHSFQDPATLDGVLLAAQTNFTLTSTHHSVPQILAPFPTVILQGRGQALDKVLEVGVLQGPPQCLIIVAIHRIQVHPQRSRK